MELKIGMKVLLKGMEEYTDLMEYLNFAFEYVQEVYEIDINEDFGLNYFYTKKFGKEPPKVSTE